MTETAPSPNTAPPGLSSAGAASQATEGVWKGAAARNREVCPLSALPCQLTKNQHHNSHRCSHVQPPPCTTAAMGRKRELSHRGESRIHHGSQAPGRACPSITVLLLFCCQRKLPTWTAALLRASHSTPHKSPLAKAHERQGSCTAKLAALAAHLP